MLFGPQQSAVVNTTGVKMGNDDFGKPPSGASIIHSAVFPLNVAPGGGASVIEKYWPVVSLAKDTWPAVVPTYWTEQKTVWPGLTRKLGMFTW